LRDRREIHGLDEVGMNASLHCFVFGGRCGRWWRCRGWGSRYRR
jgi:hypothetical protein